MERLGPGAAIFVAGVLVVEEDAVQAAGVVNDAVAAVAVHGEWVVRPVVGQEAEAEQFLS